MTSTVLLVLWFGLLLATGSTALRLCPTHWRPTRAWTPAVGLLAAFVTVYVLGFGLLARLAR